jgi:hypothetical protein
MKVQAFISAKSDKQCTYRATHQDVSSSSSSSSSSIPVAPTLEHRASVKRFVSLQSLNFTDSR